MWTEIRGKIISLNTPQVNLANVSRRLTNGRAVELTTDGGLDPQDKIDLSAVAANLRQLMATVSAQFVERDELIEAFAVGLVAGEHTFALSPPGTAKTSVADLLTQGVNGDVWTILFNQDIPRDSLVGTIDPQALQGGKWTRRWAGLARCDVAVLDEIWKSSGQNANILLSALQERRVYEGDDAVEIPLLSALAMSNEVPEDSERQAIYDRFLIRLSIRYINDAGNFESMLTADAGSQPIPQLVHTGELRLMAAAAEALALDPPQDVIDTIKSLWREIGQNGHGVSDRRWRKTLKLAMAYSLLLDEPASARHVVVAKWTLWSDHDDENEIRKLVMSKCDPVVGVVLNMEAKLADLKKSRHDIDPDDLSAKAELAGKSGKLSDEVDKVMNQNGVSAYAGRLQAVKDGAEALGREVLRMF